MLIEVVKFRTRIYVVRDSNVLITTRMEFTEDAVARVSVLSTLEGHNLKVTASPLSDSWFLSIDLFQCRFWTRQSISVTLKSRFKIGCIRT